MEGQEIPSTTLAASLFEGEGVLLSDLLSEHTSAVASKSEAKRAIKGNAVSVNKNKVADENATVTSADLLQGRYVMLENGKKNKLMVVVG